MKQTTKRLLSVALCALLLLSLLPVGFPGREALAAPEGLYRLSLVGSGFPGINEWDPADPAGDMTEISNNVYEKIMTFPEDTTISFKVVGNGQWDDRWNFGSADIVLGQETEMICGGGSANMVLTVAGGSEIRFRVDLTGLFIGENATISVENMNPDCGRKNVYAKTDWSQCYVYCWDADGSTLGSQWPGSPMSLNEDGLWEATIFAKAFNVLFNDGISNQTPDLVMPDSAESVYLCASDRWVTYQEAIAEENWGIESLSLVGSGLPGIPEWDDAASLGVMEEIADNIYVKRLEVPGATTMTFRFIGNSGSDSQWEFGGADPVPGQSVVLSRGVNATSMTLSVEAACSVWFSVDLNPMFKGGNPVLTVGLEFPSETSRKLTVVVPDEWVRAYAYTWNPESFGAWPGAELPKNGNTCEIMISQNLAQMVISGELENGTRQQTTDILLESNGKDVTVLVNGETGDYTVVYGTPEPVVYRVVGNADWMGNWDPASDAGLMTEIAPRKFQKCFKNVQPGTYEYKITKNGTWDGAYGDAGDNCVLNVGQVCDVTFTLTISIYGELDSLDVDCAAILSGDMNGDGRLNMGDVAKLYAHIRGRQNLGQEALGNADFTGDGKINMGDTARLYAHIRSNI